MWLNIFNREPKPFMQGYLPQRDGHIIHFLQYGNPDGIPVLSFHGGPGGMSRPKYAKLFDLKKYRVIQFDQRGCGLSRAADVLFHNETSYLLDDAIHLLSYLHINTSIIVHGASWGSTMALLFAIKQPKLVDKIIVSSVFLARQEDYEWVNKDSERFYPDLWAQMRKQVHNRDIMTEYYRLLFSSRKKDNMKALSYLGSYEYKLGQLTPQFKDLDVWDETKLQSSRIYFHYTRNNFFLNENYILRNAKKIRHIPTLIVHNRIDFCCPVKQAWDLHQSLPQSQLTILGGYGHSSPKIMKEIKRQLKTFL